MTTDSAGPRLSGPKILQEASQGEGGLQHEGLRDLQLRVDGAVGSLLRPGHDG